VKNISYQVHHCAAAASLLVLNTANGGSSPLLLCCGYAYEVRAMSLISKRQLFVVMHCRSARTLTLLQHSSVRPRDLAPLHTTSWNVQFIITHTFTYYRPWRFRKVVFFQRSRCRSSLATKGYHHPLQTLPMKCIHSLLFGGLLIEYKLTDMDGRTSVVGNCYDVRHEEG
jgi:hypothetical protein